VGISTNDLDGDGVMDLAVVNFPRRQSLCASKPAGARC
jgi:hypothetical protein